MELKKHNNIMEQGTFARCISSHTCDLCRAVFNDQFRFYEHLKLHYETGTSSYATLKSESLPPLPSSSNHLVSVTNVSAFNIRDHTVVQRQNHDMLVQHQQIPQKPSIPNVKANSEQKKTKSLTVDQMTAVLADVAKGKSANNQNVPNSTEATSSFKSQSNSVESTVLIANNDGGNINHDHHNDYSDDGDNYDQDMQMYMPMPNMFCHNCYIIFDNKGLLDEHIANCHPELINIEELITIKPLPPTTTTTTTGTEESKSVQCHLCSRTFSHRNSLIYHMRNHTGERPYGCKDCKKRFYASSALKIHMRIHSGEKPYQCDICNRKFRQVGDLRHHKTSIHSQEKPYQCEFCGKSFARKYSLTLHTRVHTKENNYKCKYCNMAFRASAYLSNHVRTHTGEKPHPCQLCEKRFRTKSDLKRHIDTHKKDIKICTVIGAVSVEGLSDNPELIPVVTCENQTQDKTKTKKAVQSYRTSGNDTVMPPETKPNIKDIVVPGILTGNSVGENNGGVDTDTLLPMPTTIDIAMPDGASGILGNSMTAVLQDSITLYQGSSSNLDDLIIADGSTNTHSPGNTIVFLYP